MINRRSFLQRAALSTAALASPAAPSLIRAAGMPKAETLVKTLYDSLSEAQRTALVFAFDDPLRSKISNNWHITEQRIGAFLNADQNAMVREIFLNLHSEEYRDKVMAQVVHDSGAAGFGDSSVAIFGEPGTGKFQFVLTGRHCTRRVDGDSVAGKAFGGPIFYGHAAEGFREGPEHKGNAYWYQAQSANKIFQMLDGKQRETALIEKEPGDTAAVIQLKRQAGDLPGLATADMTADQKTAVRGVLNDLLMPFREADRVESMALIEKGGFDDLHLSFYKEGDIGNDGVWDNWRLEGPHMVWYFRGSPHVHTWVHVSDPETPREPRA
ncbi:MAG: DUF3500 domain-containing protein [Verrucomicrobiales bacterium]|jgi:hypothetical protein|nr:DUF3500 domain-containing protein [Verrucomicrobiales bacterium]MDP5006033.1 DUF3500 domain-containing protein [Verrucomicrobiales bacterium]